MLDAAMANATDSMPQEKLSGKLSNEIYIWVSRVMKIRYAHTLIYYSLQDEN